MNGLLDTAPCGFLSFTDEGVVTTVNATLSKILGFPPEALLGQHINAILPMSSRLFFQTHLLPLLKTQGYAEEIYLAITSLAGAEIPVLLNAVRNQREQKIFNDCVLMTIHQRNEYENQLLHLKQMAELAVKQKEQIYEELKDAHKRLEDKRFQLIEAMALLEKLASTDELTDLKNRRTFEETLSREIENARRTQTALSLIIVDADHFKIINDTLGHPMGDRYLQLLAKILRGSVRKTDLVARYGGEEFVLVLPDTTAPGSMVLAEKLRVAVATAEWPVCPLTASLGVATLSESITDKTQLLKFADQALYVSKKNGRNQVTHADQLELLVS